MAIKTVCPHCRKKLSLKDDSAGKRGKCPACGQAIDVPFGQTRGSEWPVPPSPVEELLSDVRSASKERTVLIPDEYSGYEAIDSNGTVRRFSDIVGIQKLLTSGRITGEHCARRVIPKPETNDQKKLEKWERATAWTPIVRGLAKTEFDIKILYEPIHAYMLMAMYKLYHGMRHWAYIIGFVACLIGIPGVRKANPTMDIVDTFVVSLIMAGIVAVLARVIAGCLGLLIGFCIGLSRRHSLPKLPSVKQTGGSVS